MSIGEKIGLVLCGITLIPITTFIMIDLFFIHPEKDAEDFEEEEKLKTPHYQRRRSNH